MRATAFYQSFCFPVIVASAVIRRLCTVYNQRVKVYYTMHGVVFILYSIQHTLYSVQYIRYSVQRTAHRVQCKLQYTMYSTV